MCTGVHEISYNRCKCHNIHKAVDMNGSREWLPQLPQLPVGRPVCPSAGISFGKARNVTKSMTPHAFHARRGRPRITCHLGWERFPRRGGNENRGWNVTKYYSPGRRPLLAERMFGARGARRPGVGVPYISRMRMIRDCSRMIRDVLGVHNNERVYGVGVPPLTPPPGSPKGTGQRRCAHTYLRICYTSLLRRH